MSSIFRRAGVDPATLDASQADLSRWEESEAASW